MARAERDKPFWDPEDAHGITPNPSAYRWSHAWAFYVAVMCGLIGVIALLGAVAPFSFLRTLGALGVLAGVVTIRVCDSTSRTSHRLALLWFLVTVGVVVGGAALWLSTS
jgi:hypothetical protein